MKLLVIKTESIVPAEFRSKITDDIREGLKNGVIFVDPSLSYEVVEFDSYTIDKAMNTDYILETKKPRRRGVPYRRDKSDLKEDL